MATKMLMFVVAAVGVVAANPSASDVVNRIDAQVHDIHKAFIRLEKVTAPYHYSYGYEFYDWKTKLTQGQHETRYGDVASGTFYRVSPEGDRTTVQYKVDTPHGFQPSVSTDVVTLPIAHAYSDQAGPLAFGSLAAPEEFASHTSLLDDGSSPHALYARITHNNVLTTLNLEAPFNLTFGYQVKDPQGRTRSQYETYQGVQGYGRYTTVEVNGTQISINTGVSAAGFSATEPVYKTTPILLAAPVTPTVQQTTPKLAVPVHTGV